MKVNLPCNPTNCVRGDVWRRGCQFSATSGSISSYSTGLVNLAVCPVLQDLVRKFFANTLGSYHTQSAKETRGTVFPSYFILLATTSADLGPDTARYCC